MTPASRELAEWIAQALGEQLGIDPQAIDVHERFSRYGLESVGAIALIKRLSERLGRPISAVAVWRAPTPHALAQHLLGEASAEGADQPGPDQSGQDLAGDNRPIEPARLAAGAQDEPIAILGMACRFPGAPSLDAFWRLLDRGEHAIREVPRERWDTAAWAEGGSRWGGFLDQIDRFDPMFFGISPREASTMDPQQRLMLELAWEALEDAGIVPATLKGSQTGVYIGSAWVDYARLVYRQGPQALTQHTVTGHHRSILANRVSYVLGLQGPSLSLDSACSSALVAVHLACEGLARGDAEVALAGAVNLNLLPEGAHAMTRFGALSPDGRCFTFDARANGYVRGEGGAVVVLKRLSRALADGDPIACVIRGSAVNNDGASNGLTAPNPVAQEALLRAAYRRARVSPADVQYVELHGTGTQLGDPIEASALGAVLGKPRVAVAPLRVGSAKTNVGHLEGAAGMVGLLKAALCIRHRRLVPSLNFESPNPHIPLAALKLQVQRGRGPWPEMERPLVAGVSSFGMGGTNAHAVIAEWPSPPTAIVPLAAHSEEALSREAGRLLEALDASPEAPLPRVEAPAEAAAHRLAVTARSPRELAQGLRDFLKGRPSPRVTAGRRPPGEPPRPVLVYAGQGVQWLGMGLSLLHREPVFRAAIERCDALIQHHLGWSLLDELTADPARSRLDQVPVGWPASTAVQIALTALWRTWGIEPAAVVGHSGGEIAAAYVAGALPLEDAMAIICAYARMLDRVRGRGAMAVVGLPWDAAGAELVGYAGGHAGGYEGRLFRAIHHGVSTTVFAGEPDAVDALLRTLEARGTFCRRLPVDVAPHCPLVGHLRAELLEALRGIRPRAARVPIASAALGARVPGERCDAEHWVKNFCEPLAFSAAIDGLIDDGHGVFLEVSPHPGTLHAIQSNLRHRGREGAALPSLRRDEDEHAVMLDTLAALYALGAPVRWDEVGPARVSAVTAAVTAAAAPSAVTAAAAAAAAEAPAPASASASASVPVPVPVPVPVSARTEAALRAQAAALAAHLEARADLRPIDVARTLGTARTHFEQRAVVLAADRAELLAGLGAIAQGDSAPHVVRGEAAAPGKLVFVFPGQGSQWPEMARALLDTSEVFRARIDACAAALAPHVDWSLLAVLRGEDGAPPLARVDVVQPVLFAMMVSLAELWRHLGIRPDAAIGHSQGEIAAACVAGALSLDDAARIVARRSRALARLCGRGAMALVELSAAELGPRLLPFGDQLAVAAVNGPRATVVSGEPAAVEALLGELGAAAIFSRKIQVDYASHGPQVDALAGELAELLGGIRPVPPALPFVSTVTGRKIDGAELDAGYWFQNLRQTVRFADTVQALAAEGHHAFVEVSPHPVLAIAIMDTLDAAGRAGAVVGSLRRDAGDLRQLLRSVAELHVRGASVDWGRLLPARRRAPLPTYAFQRERCWIEASPAAPARPAGARHGLFGPPVASSLDDAVWLWEGTASTELAPYLADHVVDGRAIMPGAAYAAMVLDAAEHGPWAASAAESGAWGVWELERMELHAAMDVSPPAARTVQLALIDRGSGAAAFRISSRDPAASGWVLHASGALRDTAGDGAARSLDVQAIRARCAERVAGQDHYAALRARGLGYGPGFAGVTAVWRGRDEALGAIAAPPARPDDVVHRLDPRWLDAALQVALALEPGYPGREPGAAVMPVRWRSLRVHDLPRTQGPDQSGSAGQGCAVAPIEAAGTAWSHVRLRATDAERRLATVDVAIADASGRLLIEVEGLDLQRLEAPGEGERVLRLAWRETPRAAAAAPAARHWILVGHGAAVDPVRERLLARGQTASVIDALELAAGDGARAHALVRDLVRRDGACAGVVHLASLAIPEPDGAASMVAASEPVWASALHLVQALARQGWRDPPRLWLVTRGVADTGDHGGAASTDAAALAGAPLVGLGRTLVYEHPELRCTRLDLSIAPSPRDADDLIEELLADPGDDEIAIRGDRRFAARLELGPLGPRAARRAPANGRPFRLEPRGPAAAGAPGAPGGLGSATFRELERRAPSEDEVELELGVAALEPDTAGARASSAFACAGRIAAIGSGTSGLRVGQDVVAIHPAGEAVATHAVIPASLVATVPPGWSLEDAASTARGLVTASYALAHVARAEAGERILVHAAASAAGAAALQVARQLGLETYAVAADERARTAALRLGVQHVVEAHPREFAERVLALTGGRGVDIVLDPGRGEASAESLRALAPCGRLLELGDPRASGAARLDPASFPRSLSYAAIDLGEVARARPRLVASLLADAVQRMSDRTFHPLPARVVPASQLGSARGAGELVLDLRDPEVALEGSGPRLVADASYLVTGGMGGLGLRLARWLFERGARRLVLAGRGAPTEAARALVRTLEQGGATVVLAAADVARRDDVARLLDEATALAPLRGVFHLAGVLDDALIAQQDAARFRRVMAPKLDGAWHLHQLTQGRELDFFVVYSSIAALVGSPGQTNYAAANSFLDALVAHRRARELPGQSLQWGPISEVGLAAATGSRGERLQDRGMASMSPEAGEAILASILARDEACAGIVSLDVARWLDFYPTLSASAFFGDLIEATADKSGAAPGATSSAAPAHHAAIERLRAAPAPLRLGQLEDLVRRQLARVLQCRPEALTAHVAFSAIGLESLTGLELRNRIEAETGLRLPATIIWARGNIASLARELLERLFPDGEGRASGAAAGSSGAAAAAPAAVLAAREPAPEPARALSEEELLADLARELDEVDASNPFEPGR